MSWPGLDEQVSVMPGLDPGTHDETPRTRTVLIFAVAIHHGLPGQARQWRVERQCLRFNRHGRA